MKVATLQDLIAANDPSRLESPLGFDHEREVAAVRALKEPLERLLGEKMQLDTHMQDSSHFAEFAIYDRSTAKRSETYIGVRFSAFGHFFTIWGRSSQRTFGEDIRARVADLVSSHGFVYAPTELLDQPYIDEHFRDWWLRYFDYL